MLVVVPFAVRQRHVWCYWLLSRLASALALAIARGAGS